MDTPDSAHTHCEREAAKSWRTLEPFHALSDTAWAQVSAKLQTQTVTEGEVILRAGDTALQAFILLRGYAEVAVGDTERVVSKVTEGVLFGELDLLMVCL
jgi:CRP-like cAMP-binding protein